MSNQAFWTYELNNDTLVITEDFGLIGLSITLISGTGQVDGGLTLSNGFASTPINLTIGQPINLFVNTLPINNWTITTTGVVQLIGLQ